MLSINHYSSESLKKNIPKNIKKYIFHRPENQGHPVVSSVNWHRANIYKYIDYHLPPVLKQIPSYIKDANDFLNKTSGIGNIPPNSYFVMMDVIDEIDCNQK